MKLLKYEVIVYLNGEGKRTQIYPVKWNGDGVQERSRLNVGVEVRTDQKGPYGKKPSGH